MRLPALSAAVSLRAPQHGPDAGDKLVGGEGLRHVVVEAGLQPLDDVVLALAGGEHDDREGGKVAFRAAPDAPDELQAVHPGHQAVGYEEVRDLAAHEEIERLVDNSDKRYYIHCYLGKHRVDLVRQKVASEEAKSAAAEEEPLPNEFERGRLAVFGDEEVILGPYPTDEEWFNFVLRRGVKEVVSTLDPRNPSDAPWIEKERRICRENDITFTLRPLKPNPPNPARVKEIASYARSRDHKVYVHSFNADKRFDALESALQRTADKQASTGEAGRG